MKLKVDKFDQIRTTKKTGLTVRVKDKISIKKLLEKIKMMSVNQTQSQIKLVEMWKSKNIDNYPIKPVIVTVTESGTTTRNLESGIKHPPS